MRSHPRCAGTCCITAVLLLGGCESEAPPSQVDASTTDSGDALVASDVLLGTDRTAVDVRDEAPPPALDAPFDRAPPGDAPDKFGDVAEATDDAIAPDGAITATVTVSQMPSLLPGGFLSVASASFTRRSGGATERPPCVTTTMGACTVERCMVSPSADAGAAPMVSVVGAGVVEVDGLRVGRIALPRLPPVGLYVVNRFEEVFRGGETIRVRATGDAMSMPPFVAVVTAPAPIALTAPSLPAGATTLPVSVSAALPLRWSGGGTESVEVTLVGSSVPVFPPSTSDRTQVTVGCRFPATPGAAMIPIEVMAQLRGSVSGTVTISTAQTRTFRVAPHVVSLYATATAAQWTATFP